VSGSLAQALSVCQKARKPDEWSIARVLRQAKLFMPKLTSNGQVMGKRAVAGM